MRLLSAGAVAALGLGSALAHAQVVPPEFRFSTGMEYATGTDGIRELSGFVSYHVNGRWRFEVYAFTGFGDFSPDWGGGILASTDLRPLRGGGRQ